MNSRPRPAPPPSSRRVRQRGHFHHGWSQELQPIESESTVVTSTLHDASSFPPAPPPPAPPPPAPPPPALPPPSASSASSASRSTAVKPGTLPRSLKVLGNHETWSRVEAHIRLRPRKVLVLHGPTGAGKTEGVRALARTMRRRLVEFDGSDPEFPHELVRWVRDTRLSAGMKGESMLLLDDFESFTAQARREVVKLLLDQERDTNADAQGAHLCPIVITCTQLRHPDMRDLTPFASERLRAPNANQIRDWFEHTSVVIHRPDGSTQHVVASIEWLNRQSDLCASGDLRRMANAIRWEQHGEEFQRSDRDLRERRQSRPLPVNIFEGTRSLLLKKPQAIQHWAHLAEKRDMNLLREHLPRYVPDLNVLCYATDTFSSVLHHHPERFEAHGSHLSHQLYASALVTHLTTRARDVGALAPPPRFPEAGGLVPTTPGVRPMTTSEWRDVPESLRGSS